MADKYMSELKHPNDYSDRETCNSVASWLPMLNGLTVGYPT